MNYSHISHMFLISASSLLSGYITTYGYTKIIPNIQSVTKGFWTVI